MSIFYEYDETIGGFEHDPNGDVDVRNPNSEDDHYEENDYQEFNHVGDDSVRIKEYTSVFHDEVITEGDDSKEDEKEEKEDKEEEEKDDESDDDEEEDEDEDHHDKHHKKITLTIDLI